MNDAPASSDVSKGGVGLKDYACLPCRQRKVKCDRHVPCHNCRKSNNAQQCSFVPPTRGSWKRKQTKPPKEGLHAKLKRYEDLLKSLGADINSEEKEDAADELDVEVLTPANHDTSEQIVSATPTAMAEQESPGRGRDSSHFVGRNGSSKYFDSALWAELGQMHPEIDDNSESAHEEDDRNAETENFLFLDLALPKKINLTEYWPNTQLLSRLKTIFVDRGDPLLKIFHIPTFWSSLDNALRSPREVSKGLEAVMLAWCFATVSILEDSECISLLGAERRRLFSRFRIATQRALAKARFLHTSDPDVLRAYMCYLVGIQSEGLCASLFVMAGVAVRLGQTMGLHRDGVTLGLSPFETEMRRRLWWHLVHLDFRAADIHGALPSLDLSTCDAKYPLNLEDDELYPDMAEFRKEHEGITGITGCILRCEIIEALRRFSKRPTHIRWDIIRDFEIPLTKKEEIINEIESHLETKYLRYCDPLTPYHQLIAVMVRLPVSWMRFFAHNPRPFGNGANEVPQKSLDIAFAQAIKMLEYASWMNSGMNGLGKFMWQSGISVLWRAMLYVLIEIKHRKSGFDVDRAWHVITEALSKRPQMFEVSTPVVYRALTVWTLEVWNECSPIYTDENRLISHETLDLMDKLQGVLALRKQTSEWKNTTAHTSQAPVAEESELLGTGFSSLDLFGFDFPPLTSIASDLNGWETCEDFLAQDAGSI